MRSVAATLERRHASAVKVRLAKRRGLVPAGNHVTPAAGDDVSADQLVFYTISPDYCLPDRSVGSAGTRHRWTITHTHARTQMEYTVEYDGLRHRWARRWATSPIRDEQVLLHLSHGQTVPVVLMTCCLRAASFLSSSATRDSSTDAVADWHVVRHCARSNGAVLSDWGRRPHLFMLVLTVYL